MRAKRIFDVACLIAALPLFGLPMLVIALVIKLDDGGPVFFRQRRVGRGQSEFEVLKFRTMQEGTITRAGRWLRLSGLDELPQFLNVLCGQMSIVGPRPLTRNDIERLGWAQGEILERWSVKPGITGLAQIYFGQGARASANFDLRYVRELGLWLDFKIVVISFAMNIAGKRRVRRWLMREAA